MGVKVALAGCALVCAACGSSDGASAEVTPSGTGGVSGSGGGPAGTGGVVTQAQNVFSASIAKPSKDCRTEQVAKVCISAAGTWMGAPVDVACTLDTSPRYNSGYSWSMDCYTGTHKLGVDIPYAPMGGETFVLSTRSYDYKFLPHDAPRDTSVSLEEGNPAAPSASDPSAYPGSSNFISAEVAGDVLVDTTTHLDTLSGTFTASWGPPGAGSRDLSAELNGTFFSIQGMHPCRTNADCSTDLQCVTSTCF
jgi:hypothetical protein